MSVECLLVSEIIVPNIIYDNKFKYLCFNNEKIEWIQDVILIFVFAVIYSPRYYIYTTGCKTKWNHVLISN
jgi:hypothetical protein